MDVMETFPGTHSPPQCPSISYKFRYATSPILPSLLRVATSLRHAFPFSFRLFPTRPSRQPTPSCRRAKGTKRPGRASVRRRSSGSSTVLRSLLWHRRSQVGGRVERCGRPTGAAGWSLKTHQKTVWRNLFIDRNRCFHSTHVHGNSKLLRVLQRDDRREGSKLCECKVRVGCMNLLKRKQQESCPGQ